MRKSKGLAAAFGLLAVLGFSTLSAAGYLTLNEYSALKADRIAVSEVLEARQKAKEEQRQKEAKAKEKVPTQKAQTASAPSLDWEKLKKSCPQAIGWICFENLNISHPIVQSKDNEFYLNHSPEKEEDKYGAIFLDCRNNSDFSDPNSIIYGHSSLDMLMFSELSLLQYDPQFEENPYFWILTPQADYKCSIYAYLSSDSSVSKAFDLKPGAAKEGQLIEAEGIQSRQLPKDRERIITLSTCNLKYGFDTPMRHVIRATVKEDHFDKKGIIDYERTQAS